jgi:hypothetical protein
VNPVVRELVKTAFFRYFKVSNSHQHKCAEPVTVTGSCSRSG